ncbi:hypothetical protein BDV93DRAFT_74124 [Ceratobasidium sp. AG-I]|nr:hypothetical protein BDV93DRAFT_74124 [Ceratobasidium sp. AG-I]
MSLALDGPLLLSTLNTLKTKHSSSTNRDKSVSEDTTATSALGAFPSEPVSILAFIKIAQHPPPHSKPLVVTSIEWREAPSGEIYHAYAVIHASTSIQSEPIVAIRVDRYGNIGIREKWWKRRPSFLNAKNNRALTTVLAGSVDDAVVKPSAGVSVIKHTHWTHSLPSTAPIPELKHALERARKDACTALNHALRPYVPHNMHPSTMRHGQRWANSRGLELVHNDVAGMLAAAMDTNIIQCAVEGWWAWVLPMRIPLRSVRRKVQAREEYSHVVNTYHTELLRIIRSHSTLNPDARSAIATSWGVPEHPNTQTLLVRLLNHSLSNHAFVSPHAPVATLSDVVSRLGTLISLLPISGPTTRICELYTRTLAARLPDELWHAYAPSISHAPISTTRATWHRARDSRMFWVCVNILMQWIIGIALLPVNGFSELWVLVLPLMHAIFGIPWILKERKFWRRIWKVYEGGLVQGENETWHRDQDDASSQRAMSFQSGKWGNSVKDIPLDVLLDH